MEESPGRLQALINALRGAAGLGQQQSPGPAMNLQNAYRDYVESASVQGQQPVPFQVWVQQQQGGQQQPVGIPR